MWLYLPLLLLALVTAAGAFVRWHAQLFVHFLACFIDARARAREDEERMTLLSIETHVACCPTEAVAQAATADEMTKALHPASLATLCSSRSSSEQFVHLFAQSEVHLSSLSVQLLADVIAALQPFASSRQVAEFIANCLCAKASEDCSALKAMVDDRIALYDLVYHKIADAGIREAILTHFQAQTQSANGLFPPLKLIFNGEDAVSPGFAFSQSPVVPGLRRFVYEVTTTSRLNLSGRAIVLTGHKRPDQRAMEQTLGSKCTVLQDSPRSRFGLRRAQVDHFGDLVRLFPECRFVLIDFTGRDDYDHGRRLLQLDARTAILVHHAVAEGHISESDDDTGSLRFQTYMSAIFQLFQRGLVSPEAVGRVVGATLSEARSIRFPSQEYQRSVTRQLMVDTSTIMEQLTMDDASAVLYASVPLSRRRSSLATGICSDLIPSTLLLSRTSALRSSNGPIGSWLRTPSVSHEALAVAAAGRHGRAARGRAGGLHRGAVSRHEPRAAAALAAPAAQAPSDRLHRLAQREDGTAHVQPQVASVGDTDSHRPTLGIRYSGRVPMYTDTMNELAQCETQEEQEALLRTLSIHRLLSSSVKAQHFAQYCQTSLDLTTLPCDLTAKIIYALHKQASERIVAEFLRDCFCAKQAAACVELKCEVDRHLPLFGLVFYHITSRTVREHILAHFKEQAAALQSSEGYSPQLKLVCDIDDTLLSTLFDTRYPELTVYPGVHQFVHELDHLSAASFEHPQSSVSSLTTPVSSPEGPWSSKRRPMKQRITFLTARPELFRKRSTRDLKACGFSHFTLVMGRMAKFVGSKRIASAKLENFTRLRQVFPDCRFLFVGDNGQGDIDLGKVLLRSPQLYNVSAVLIHDVIRNHLSDPPSSCPSSGNAKAAMVSTAPLSKSRSYRWRECDRNGIHLFRTYIGAAFQLYVSNAVSIAAVVRVVQQTVQVYEAIVFDSPEQQQSLAHEIMADVRQLMDELPSQDALALASSLPDALLAVQTAECGSVTTDDDPDDHIV